MTSINEFVDKYKVVLGLAIAVVAVTVIYITTQAPTPVPTEGQQPSVTEQTLSPTTYQQVRTWFGPWELATPGSTGSPRLAMLRNKAVEVSSWIVPVDESWKQETFTDVQAVTGDKNIRLRLNTGDEYEIGYSQPFIIGNRPETVYAYTLRDMRYVVVSISSDQAYKTGRKK
jgi:hypothetical protein